MKHMLILSIKFAKFRLEFLSILFFILILFSIYFQFWDLELVFEWCHNQYCHTSVTSDSSITVIVTQSHKYIKYGGRFKNNNII